MVDCHHLYGIVADDCDPVFDIDKDNYSMYEDNNNLEKFTYCPYCRVQLHTIDGVPLGLPEDDDCIRGGCED